MRVVLLHSSSELYGSDRILALIAQSLVERGMQVDVVLPGQGPLADVLSGYGATVHVGGILVARRDRRIADWSQLRPTALLRVARLIRAADVVHVNTSVVLTPLMLPSKARLVYSIRETFFASSRLERILATAINLRADAITAPSTGSADAFCRASLRSADVTVVSDALMQRDDEATAVYDPPGRPAIGCVGRFNRWKGQGDLIRAFARIGREFPSAQLVFAGGALPSQRDHLDDAYSLAAASGVADRIHFLGEVADGEQIMRGCDVVAVPSMAETFGLVVLEAMRSGCAVVASRTAGPSEIITDGKDGLLFPPGDVDALAECLRRLLKDPIEARRIALAGTSRVADFTCKQMSDDLESIYTDRPFGTISKNNDGIAIAG